MLRAPDLRRGAEEPPPPPPPLPCGRIVAVRVGFLDGVEKGVEGEGGESHVYYRRISVVRE